MTLPISQISPTDSQADLYSSIIRRVFHIDEVTYGDQKQRYLLRYRGHLVIEPATAYDNLVAALSPLDVTPLFRKDKDQDVIILLNGVIHPRPSRTWINLALLAATLLTVLWTGINYAAGDVQNASLIDIIKNGLGGGLAYTASLLAILLAHEFGHYLAARYHRSAVSLPYFLPLPFPISPFGTMGAFIQLKEPPKNKRILLDIGIAGPLAGLVVAIPILFLGLYLSKIDRLPLVLHPGEGFSLEGNSIFYLLAKYIVFGQWLPHPTNFQGLDPLIYWVRYFFTGRPVPFGGTDVLLHPIAWAGWAGLLVTALNLIPAGQLDGGHMLFVLIGNKARSVMPYILIILIALGLFWSGWWFWAFLIFLLGRVYAEPLDQITPLDPRRKAIAILGLIIFTLVFTPIPLNFFIA